MIAAVLAVGCGPAPQRPVAVGPVQPVRSEAAPVVETPMVEPPSLLAELRAAAGKEWRPLVVSGDGATLGGWLGEGLVLAARTGEVRRVPTDGEEAEQLLRREGFRRLADEEVLPAYEVTVVDGKVRARWADRVGQVEPPDVPRRFCCTWTARPGFTLAGRDEVFAEISMTCGKPGLGFCDDVEGRAARELVVVPLVAPATARQRYRGLPDSVVERMPDALGPTQQLANMLYVGPFGPGPDGVLVLRVDDVGGLSGFLQTVLAGKSRRLPVPHLPWVMHEVNDVVYADADGDGADEAVVLVTALTGIGPTGAEEFAGAHVIKWDGAQLVTLPDVEMRLGGATKPAQVRARLQRRGK